MRHMLLSFAIMVLACSSLYAQASAKGTDPQVRILNHVQRFEPDRQVGWALWAVVPNVLKTDPVRGLAVVGIGLRNEEKTRWIELMGGGFVDTRGNIDPVVDIRFADNSNKQLAGNGEALYAFRTRRILVSGAMSTPLPVVRSLKLRAGAESDLSFDRAGAHAGLGWRLVGEVPKSVTQFFGMNTATITLAVAQQKGLINQRDVVRVYATIYW